MINSNLHTRKCGIIYPLSIASPLRTKNWLLRNSLKGVGNLEMVNGKISMDCLNKVWSILGDIMSLLVNSEGFLGGIRCLGGKVRTKRRNLWRTGEIHFNRDLLFSALKLLDQITYSLIYPSANEKTIAMPFVHWHSHLRRWRLIIPQCIFMYIPLAYPQCTASLFSGNNLARSLLVSGAVLFCKPIVSQRWQWPQCVSLSAGFTCVSCNWLF